MDRDGGGSTSNESEILGRVTYRSRAAHHRPRDFDDTASLPDDAYRDESFVPIRPNVASRSPNVRRPGSPFSETDLYPPDLGEAAPGQSNSFKSWLTTGILDALGTAAGVTLSTTGRLVAPPLQMTKSILLPGLLALIVDTLDTITPPRVQDWFRIISSSVYHLFVVLGNTERGQIFSSQVYIVLQDILQAVSAPESRQVLVDGMATSVKFAAALHTPEMLEFLEQLSTLGIRLLDAASSGKAKQLMHDTKDLAWKGIEMATDPATTLALAEVTAHLCHALEDTQQALNPTPRKQRNAQNQAVYLNPYQMADFPEQVTMEEVILSCLGRVEDNRKEAMGDDGASLPSRLTFDDDISTTEPDTRDWAERKEQVNVQLLRERIMDESWTKSRVEQPATIPVEEDLPTTVEQSKERDVVGKAAVESGDRRPPPAIKASEVDMEDIKWSRVPGRRRFGLESSDKRKEREGESVPALVQFYQRLDELLEKDRQLLESRRAARNATTINNSLEDGDADPWKSWKAKMNKLRQSQKSRAFPPKTATPRVGTANIPTKYHGIILAILALAAFIAILFSGLAVYGMYAFAKGSLTKFTRPPVALYPKQEVVIRIVREVVHVTESGQIIGESRPQILTQEELDKIGQTVAEALRL